MIEAVEVNVIQSVWVVKSSSQKEAEQLKLWKQVKATSVTTPFLKDL